MVIGDDANAKQTAYAVGVNVNYANVTAVMVVVLESATHKTTTGFVYRSFSGSQLLDADVKGPYWLDFPKPVQSFHMTLHQQKKKC